MFAQRFDPGALTSPQGKVPLIRRNVLKRSREVESESDSESDSENESDSDNSSDSGSDNSSGNSSSDSSGDSASDSDSNSDNDEQETVHEQRSENELSEHVNGSVEESVDESGTNSSKTVVENEDPMEIDTEPIENDPKYTSKHSAIFKKLNKAITKENNDDSENENELSSSDEEMQDLAPIPQPILPRDKRLKSNTFHSKNLDWLATPVYAKADFVQSFETFQLSPFMLTNLSKLGYENAFSVQCSMLSLVMPEIRQSLVSPDFHGDVLANASTGSGKTLAYLIPIVELLQSRIVPRVRAIILVPTKPLISQVKQTFIQLSRGTNLTVVSLKNDISIADEARKLMSNEPDIIISTPGRLVDHLQNGSINLKALKYLVIDEADRLLNQSFQNWAQILNSKLAELNDAAADISSSFQVKVQKFIFSATLTTDSGKLSLLNLVKPRLLIVNDSESLAQSQAFAVPSSLSEYKIQLGTSKLSLKPVILAKYLIQTKKLSDCLIFTKSNESSLRLARILGLLMHKFGLKSQVAYLNSTNNTTGIRTKLLNQFQKGEIQFIVATDLLARGIDLTSIKTVINYDLPNSSREYVHRVGRTARAGLAGDAYTLSFGKGEGKWFKKLMEEVGRGEGKLIQDVELDVKVLVSKVDESVYEECLKELQKQVFEKN